jgi:hypothetical protein
MNTLSVSDVLRRVRDVNLQCYFRPIQVCLSAEEVEAYFRTGTRNSSLHLYLQDSCTIQLSSSLEIPAEPSEDGGLQVTFTRAVVEWFQEFFERTKIFADPDWIDQCKKLLKGSQTLGQKRLPPNSSAKPCKKRKSFEDDQPCTDTSHNSPTDLSPRPRPWNPVQGGKAEKRTRLSSEIVDIDQSARSSEITSTYTNEILMYLYEKQVSSPSQEIPRNDYF